MLFSFVLYLANNKISSISTIENFRFCFYDYWGFVYKIVLSFLSWSIVYARCNSEVAENKKEEFECFHDGLCFKYLVCKVYS